MNKKLRFFEKVSLDKGEISNLKKILSDNGRTMILPYDQFVEHDNRHSFAHARANDPDFIMELALNGGFNAVAVHYGVAKRFWKKYKAKLPLILKVNGKTSIPSQDLPLSVHTSFVADAAELGASAVGYTLYYGSDRQDQDLPQLAMVRKECEKYGLPLIVWAYPRGKSMDMKGGIKSSYALESAVRLAVEMGATIVKSNIPEAMPEEFLKDSGVPAEYVDFEMEMKKIGEEGAKLIRTKRVVEAGAGIPVLFSGGGKKGKEEVIENTKLADKAGAIGLIYGRNMWKREMDDAVELAKELRGILG